MKRKIIPLVVFLCIIAFSHYSCKKYVDPLQVRPPQIAFLNTDSVISKQAGDVIYLKPIVVKAGAISQKWEYNGQLISSGEALEYVLENVGEFTLKYSATDENGTTVKTFLVKVKPATIQGVIFSTTDSVFKKSIGERLELSTTVSGNDPVTHRWTVDGKVVSNTNKLSYNIVEVGEKVVNYTIVKNNAEFSKKFYLNAISSDFGNWFKFQDGEQYVLCLKSDETKVLTHNLGATQFTFETYNGSNKQLFRKGAYFGYGDANVKLEYYNLYNMETKMTIDEKGNLTDAYVDANGNAAPEGWRGYYFEVDQDGYARMIHFLETWDYAPSYKVDVKGCIMRASDDHKALVPFFYDRCKVDGVRDHADYNSLAGKYYDLKIRNVKDVK